MAQKVFDAVRAKDLDAFKGFLDRGFPVNYHRGEGDTPLHWTAREDNPEIARFLLDHGADPNAKSDILFTPLHWAASYGHTEIVRLLLEHKANPNIDGGVSAMTNERKHETPLYLASDGGRLEAVKLLVAHGANINKRNSQGITAFHAALLNRKKMWRNFY